MFKKNQKFTGIDFRDREMLTAVVSLENSRPEIIELQTVEAEAKVMESGRIADIEGMAELLKTTVAKQTKAKTAHLAFPTQNILVRRITHLPDLPEAQLAKLLDYQVGESIHLPFETSIYDFAKIGTIQATETGQEDDQEQPVKPADKSDIIFFSTSKPLAEDLLELVTEAGLKPLTAEIRGLALQRLLKHTHPDWLAATEMVVDLSEEAVDIHIFTNGVIVFSRTMFLALEEEGQPLPDEDENTLPFDGFLSSGEAAATIETANGEPYLEEVVREIEKAQNFFRYSLGNEEEQFQRVIITGSQTDKAFSRLSERLEAMVETIDFTSFTGGGMADKAMLSASSVAIGLALKGSDRAKKKWKK